eukprot:TRINITY_DN8376_c0_g2_i1.p1 TRINITY_DN8376_c0_g2~~TRINITY_DN8376_c0_g2_i1.p1  ORF type:complete len:247 (-),score=38.93 TRINITY_DN8376_c0_g2_i1:81-821(-)
MGERSNVPTFGNWDSEDNYTVYFDKARKGKGRGSKSVNPNDTQGNPNAISKEMPPVNTPPLRTSSEPAVGHHTDSPVRHDTVDRKTVSELPHQQHGEQGINAGEPPRRGTRTSVGSDRSIEQAPLHLHYQPKVANRAEVSSPSWEGKSSSESGSNPGRSKLRSAPRSEETREQGAAVPRFGDWDENNPSSADGYTGIFNKVREERQTGGERVPVMPKGSPYSNGQNQDNRSGFETTGWFCFSWCKK